MTFLNTSSIGFCPKVFRSLAIWLDVPHLSTITKDGGDLVSNVENKGFSGVGAASQGTTLRKPKYISSAINGLPALQGRHDGTNASNLDIADVSGLDYSTFHSFVIFSRVIDSGTSEHVAGKYQTTSNLREQRIVIDSIDRVTAPSTTDGLNATAKTAFVTGAVATSSPIIAEAWQDSSFLYAARNGVNVATPTAQTAMFNGAASYTLFSRPSADSFAEPFMGYIGEHLFFTSVLTSTERQLMLYYLSAKWRIALV